MSERPQTDTDGIEYVTQTPDDKLYAWADFAAATNDVARAVGERTGEANDWLDSGETISSYTVTVPAGITKVSDTLDLSNTAVRFMTTGGTAATDYDVVVQATTSAGKIKNKTVRIKVVAEK